MTAKEIVRQILDDGIMTEDKAIQLINNYILSIVDKVVEEQVGKWHDPHSVSAIILLQARINNEIGE